MEAHQLVTLYHERTKHHFHRYARALGYLDWDSQPNPFRRFLGAPLIHLPHAARDTTPPYDRIFQPGTAHVAGTPSATDLPAITPRPLRRESVADFLYYALALSAWKSVPGSRWALRVNPSSGNLHPTEGYLLLPAVDGIGESPGVYHYAPAEHGLEQRATFAETGWESLTAGLPAGAFLVGLTSIHWREAWKYGERAYRYCQHDLGHALAALRISAATLGWRLEALDGVPDAQLARILGLERRGEFPPEEAETPDLVAVVWTAGDGPGATEAPSPGGMRRMAPLPEDGVAAVVAGRWEGRANRLSPEHHAWDIIDAVAVACRYEGAARAAAEAPAGAGSEAAAEAERSLVSRPSSRALALAARARLVEPVDPSILAGRIIRQRRSAVAMDGKTGMSRAAFYATLERVVPALCPMPWDAVPWPVCVHLGMFVHRVEGLEPGLYALVRDASQQDALRASMHAVFEWVRPPECPLELPFFRLKAVAVQQVAARVSCGQDIAGQSAFSLGMIARFTPEIEARGAHVYRNLFWETGMVGQVLYLEAEARGLRATGIGCFFDDAVHEVFGLADTTWQSLYHFTVGGPVEDTRLTTEPAYP